MDVDAQCLPDDPREIPVGARATARFCADLTDVAVHAFEATRRIAVLVAHAQDELVFEQVIDTLVPAQAVHQHVVGAKRAARQAVTVNADCAR